MFYGGGGFFLHTLKYILHKEETKTISDRVMRVHLLSYTIFFSSSYQCMLLFTSQGGWRVKTTINESKSSGGKGEKKDFFHQMYSDDV